MGLLLGLENLNLDAMETDPVLSPYESLAYSPGNETWAVEELPSRNGQMHSDPEVVLETQFKSDCPSDHELVSSKNACNDDVLLADLVKKDKKRQGLANEKKKLKTSSIKLKPKNSAKTKRKKNDYDRSKVGYHAESEHHIVDESYEEAKINWALGKSLGLCADNDEEVIQALFDVRKGNENDCTLSSSKRKTGGNCGL